MVAGSNPVSPTNEKNSPAQAERVFSWAGDMMLGAEAPAEGRGGRAGGSCQPDSFKPALTSVGAGFLFLVQSNPRPDRHFDPHWRSVHSGAQKFGWVQSRAAAGNGTSVMSSRTIFLSPRSILVMSGLS